MLVQIIGHLSTITFIIRSTLIMIFSSHGIKSTLGIFKRYGLSFFVVLWTLLRNYCNIWIWGTNPISRRYRSVSSVFRLIHTGLFWNLKHSSPGHHGLFACMRQIFMSLVFKQLGFVWSMMRSIRQRCGYLISILYSRSVMSNLVMIFLWYQSLRIFLNELLKYFVLVWWICWGDFLNGDCFCIYFSFESICMAWSG
jgi:hypothetical protein